MHTVCTQICMHVQDPIFICCKRTGLTQLVAWSHKITAQCMWNPRSWNVAAHASILLQRTAEEGGMNRSILRSDLLMFLFHGKIFCFICSNHCQCYSFSVQLKKTLLVPANKNQTSPWRPKFTSGYLKSWFYSPGWRPKFFWDTM